ncbi:hypothetical protein SAMN04488030_0363 [Aliiroseovarius halocynthiae]|uniref:DUF484 family protein n=1 Tax=Aliiroseovarius halocynthiae TaxID=985055 RepID=A0A545STT1_9RHOB|nr:DUF484 family protein [Aliiroseovarius halocynthiae]TQV68364.1 DUF484 family protein [Aliiroseovarius halocynthiae]SMR70751.1 hypothetical protein SAMN04488030_0363 [Aliiroseovarius halocynthiae]
MSSSPALDDDLRAHLIAHPKIILNDQDIMNALVTAHERQMGTNVVDLRGAAMDRLSERLDQLEDTHRSVLAAAYENVSGAAMIHRAVLRMLDPADFAAFMQDLDGEVADILKIDCLRLVLETMQDETDAALNRLGAVLSTTPAGFIDDYLGQPAGPDRRTVFLRQVQERDPDIYGDCGFWIRSEACIVLDLGEGRLPGMLVMGTEDLAQFRPGQGTDLLEFFGGVFERAMRRWLS